MGSAHVNRMCGYVGDVLAMWLIGLPIHVPSYIIPNNTEKIVIVNLAANLHPWALGCIQDYRELKMYNLKGKFPQTTMWIGREESNFTNPTVKFWANLDNPFKRTNHAKFCMSPSLDGTLPESVISQEYNSPLTLYIDFSQFIYLFFYDAKSPADQKINHKCIRNHRSPNIPKYKSRAN